MGTYKIWSVCKIDPIHLFFTTPGNSYLRTTESQGRKTAPLADPADAEGFGVRQGKERRVLHKE